MNHRSPQVTMEMRIVCQGSYTVFMAKSKHFLRTLKINFPVFAAPLKEKFSVNQSIAMMFEDLNP